MKGLQYWFNWFIAALGMDLASFYDMFFVKHEVQVGGTTTTMTNFEMTQMLEKEQDPRERERLEKQGVAGKATYEAMKPQIEREKASQEAQKKEAKRQQDEYNKLTEAEKKKYYVDRDKIEKEQQAKVGMTTYARTPMARESEISSAPKTTAPKTAPTISPAYDDYERRKSSALTITKPSAPAQPAPTKSPTIAPAKPPADPTDGYAVREKVRK